MNLRDTQDYLRSTKRYSGQADNVWGRLTEGGILLAMTDGPDTALGDHDFDFAGGELKVQSAAIKAFWKTEANGAGFAQGRPKILPEPHRFSKNTAHAFDVTYPMFSWPHWKDRPYPVSQDARYDMLIAWAKLLAANGQDLAPAFASASYGAPQIMGENCRACGYTDPFLFAVAMARDEVTQLHAFMAFVTTAGILPYLRKVDRAAESWAPVAQRYNGTAFRQNDYHIRMANAFVSYGGK